MRLIEPFHVMELLARAKALEAQGRSIIHMEVGEPDFPTPRRVCEAGIHALEAGDLFYTSALGMPELRAKSVRLTAYAERMIRAAARGVQILTPASPDDRGCMLSLRIGGGPLRGRRIFDVLSDHGIVCDWREPDVIRIAPTPLYNRFIEIFDLAETLGAALREIA
jgi:kynureninase